MRFGAQPFVIVAIGLAACGGFAETDDEVGQTAEPAPPLELSRPDSIGVLNFVNEVREAPTAATWAAAHPEWASSIIPNDLGVTDGVQPVTGRFSTWCLRARYAEPVDDDGVSVTRHFYFYGSVPDPPADFGIPETQAGIEHHLEHCRLGLVTAEVSGASGIDQGRQALIDRFAEELGPSPRLSETSAVGVTGLSGGAHIWSRGPETIGIGIRPESDRPVSYAYTGVMDAAGGTLRLPDHADEWILEAWEVVLEAAAMPDYGRQIVLSANANFFTLRNATDLVSVATEGRDSVAAESPDAMNVRYTVAHFLLADSASPGRSVARQEPGALDLIAILESRGALYQPVRFAGHRFEYTGSLADSASAYENPIDWRPLLSVIRESRTCDWVGAIDTLEPLIPYVQHPTFRPWLYTLIGDAYAIGAFHGDRSARDELRRQARTHYADAIAADDNADRKDTAWRKAFLVSNNYQFDPARFECRSR